VPEVNALPKLQGDQSMFGEIDLSIFLVVGAGLGSFLSSMLLHRSRRRG
jgi:hypothetical protein